MSDKRPLLLFIVIAIALGYWAQQRKARLHDISVREALAREQIAFAHNMDRGLANQKAYLEELARKVEAMRSKARNEALISAKVEAEKKLHADKLLVEETNRKLYGNEKGDENHEADVAAVAAKDSRDETQTPVLTAGPAPASVTATSTTPVATVTATPSLTPAPR